MAKKSILILDDEQDIHYVFDRYLGDKYNLIHALNLEEAVKGCLKEKKIDLIITDVFLEKESGVEFVHKIRDIDKKTPIIIMSAYGDRFTEELIEGLKVTFESYFIKKPFDNDEMEALIEKLISKKS